MEGPEGVARLGEGPGRGLEEREVKGTKIQLPSG